MASTHWYERLLKLYPKVYRDRYGSQMVQTLSDMLDDQPTRSGKARIWVRVAVDLPPSLMHQNIAAIGGNLMHVTPGYIRRNGAVAAVLLAPFLGAIIANSIAQLVAGHTLHASWLWSAPVLITWVVVLPAAAVLLAFISYVRYAAAGQSRPLTNRLSDVKHTWPVLLAGIAGLGILGLVVFHDSTHCWTQNPIRSVRNFHQTWQCTTDGLFGGR